MAWEEIDKDEGGIATLATLDDGKLIVKRTQDVESIIERNKDLYNNHDGYTPSKNMRHVASVPLVILEQWAREAGVSVFGPEMREITRRKLNDPDNRFLRTSPGDI